MYVLVHLPVSTVVVAVVEHPSANAKRGHCSDSKYHTEGTNEMLSLTVTACTGMLTHIAFVQESDVETSMVRLLSPLPGKEEELSCNYYHSFFIILHCG